MEAEKNVRSVVIPLLEQHEGIHKVKVNLVWVCPVCQGPRGEPGVRMSYDGSLKMVVNGWANPCGHVDKYVACIQEAKTNGLNKPEDKQQGGENAQ